MANIHFFVYVTTTDAAVAIAASTASYEIKIKRHHTQSSYMREWIEQAKESKKNE